MKTKPKILFFQTSMQHPRCLKRISEFVANGYEVEAYGFKRNGEPVPEFPYPTRVIGELYDTSSYLQRIPIIFKGIKGVLKGREKENLILYIFGLDMAMITRCVNHNHRYIFEESDLMHTYINNSIIRTLLECVDKNTIKKSLLSVFTSEGFLYYHFRNNRPGNVALVTNRLNPKVRECQLLPKKEIDINHLSVGFVGVVRFDSVYEFSSYFIKHYPQHEFHFFGRIDDDQVERYKELEKYSNCHFHGSFVTPVDLPKIYSQIDLVLSTYDVKYANVRYAEPNKLYESLYFETPIIVSKGTFLEQQVKKYNSGFTVNPLDGASIDKLFMNMKREDIIAKQNAISKVPKETSINSNDEFFVKVENYLM